MSQDHIKGAIDTELCWLLCQNMFNKIIQYNSLIYFKHILNDTPRLVRNWPVMVNGCKTTFRKKTSGPPLVVE